MERNTLFEVSAPITVMTYDIDFAGIVHNVVYIRWLEDLRSLLLLDEYPIEAMLADGVTPVLTHTDIAYKWPIRLGDAVQGKVRISRARRTRWEVQAEIWNGEHLAAAATQQGYFADLASLRPVRIPARLRKLWEAQRP